MQRIAVLNQKGGVGKTTTSVNLASGLTRLGQKVCLVDLDPQAHATTHLGVANQANLPTLYHALVQNQPLPTLLKQVKPGLFLIPADLNLAAAEVELAGVVGRELILKDQVENLTLPDGSCFDWIIMDCGPSLGVLTLNALAASHEVIIPLQPHFLALHGMGKLFETTGLVARRINPQLKVLGILLSLYEPHTRLAQEVAGDLSAFLQKSSLGKQPWSGARIFQTKIRRNIKLAEAPGFGQAIFDYAPQSHGADDYDHFARELLNIVQDRKMSSEEANQSLHARHDLAPPASISTPSTEPVTWPNPVL